MSFSFYEAVWVVSGIVALAASCLSMNLIFKHLQHYTKPHLQKYIIRILWMIPIYTLDSFLSLRFYDQALYFDVWRDCYEAYVLYCFFSLLIAYLDGLEALAEILQMKSPTAHPFPMNFLPKFSPGGNFLLWCRRGILQFVLVKPVLSCVALFLEMRDLYEDGVLRWDRGYLYIAIINNISITISLYYLVLFYIVTEDNLRPFKPLPKFLCIKSVIFFSFWQGVAIVALVKLNLIVDLGEFTAGNIALFLHNFLICFEMFGLAVVHHYVFGYEKFMSNASGSPPTSMRDTESDQSSPRRKDLVALEEGKKATPKSHSVFQSLQDVANVSDVLVDARDVFHSPRQPPVHPKNT